MTATRYPDGSVTNTFYDDIGRIVAAQDEREMEEGILDLNVPMDFFNQASALYTGVYADWASFVKDHKYNRHVAIGQASFLNSIPDTLAQLQVARQAHWRRQQGRGHRLLQLRRQNPWERRVGCILEHSKMTSKMGA